MLRTITAFARRHADLLILGMVITMALIIRLAFTSRALVFVSKDSQSYFLPSWDLVHGNELVLGLRRTPGYPLFLALIQVVFGSDLSTIVLIQHIFGVGTAAFSCLLGRLVFGRLAGLIAGLLVAFSAPLIIFEHYILTESLFTFALTGAMLTLVLAMRSQRQRGAYLAGLTLGLAAMVRPVGQLLAPVVLAAVGLSRLPRWRHAAVAVVLCALGLATVLLPWAIRNRLVNELGSTTTFGRTLIARTAYYDRGFAFYAPGWGDEGPAQVVEARKIVQAGANRRQPDGTIAGRLREELNLGPIEVNEVMRTVATEAIMRRLDYFLLGSLEFAWVIFEGKEETVRNHADEVKDVTWNQRTAHLLPTKPTPEQERLHREAQRLLNVYQPAEHAVPLALLCILGTAGALVRGAWRIALPIAGAAAIHIVMSAALDGPQERYRYTVDPLISVIAGGGVATLVWIVTSAFGSVTRFLPTPSRQTDATVSS